MKAAEIYSFLNSYAPYSSQLPWDNSGFMTGSPEDEADCVTLSLDCTNDVLRQMTENGSSLLVCHHPLIFTPLKKIKTNSPPYNAVKYGITVISCHTNLDIAEDGVNDALARKIGLCVTEKICAEGAPIMRKGVCKETALTDFARLCAERLNNSVKLYDSGKSVKNVAVCGGAGGEYIEIAAMSGCDTFVTGEAKHHEFLNAASLGINLIAAGHFATERPVIETLEEKLREAFPYLRVISAKENNPYKTVIQNGS